MILFLLGLLSVCLFSTGPAVATAVAEPLQAPIEVAITIDDLPAHSGEYPGLTRLEIASRMIRALQDAKLPPVYGFANGQSLEWDPTQSAVFEAWHDAGLPLGNHTYRHLDLGQVSADLFVQDLDHMATVLRTWQRPDTIPMFRYPYLNEGETHEKRAEVRAALRARGYQIAPVTVDYHDWAWSDAYARCVRRQNEAAMRWLEDQVLITAQVELGHAQRMATQLVGRDIKHVLLLHLSAFTARILPDLVSIFRAQGVRFISLEEAVTDPVYGMDPDQVGHRDQTFLMQVQRSLSLDPPAGVTERERIVFQTLRGLCS